MSDTLRDVPGHSTRPKLVVDTTALADNYRALKTIVGETHIGASVKADAYGTGLERTAKALYGAGCRNWFVATPGEGMILRNAVGPNGSIYVLNGPAPQDLGLFFKGKLKPVLNSTYQVALWAEHAGQTPHAPYCAVMFDTGMNRLGLNENDATKLANASGLLGRIRPDHLMSHLACAPDPNHPLNAEQLKRFKRIAGLYPKMTHSIANSAGIFLGPDYHLQMVRPGIALYGGAATETPKSEPTRPVVTLEASVLQVKDVRRGESIGYDATYVAPRDMRIAVAAAGYADGLPVAVSGTAKKPGGRATLRDEAVTVVGRVSMDLVSLDVTDVEGVGVGDTVKFLGPHLHATARRAGTIDYELLVRCGSRLRREHRSASPSSQRPGPRASAGAGRSPKSRDRTSRRPAGSRPRS